MIRDGYRVDEGAIGRTCSYGRGKGCSRLAFRVRSKSAYCLKHHRFHQMRKEAGSRGLAIPTWRQLDMLLPVDMVCHECDEPMLWTVPANSDRRGSTISLQHYRDGSFGLIHLRCNVIHKNRNGVIGEHDRLPEGVKPCPVCKEILPIDAFPPNAARVSGRGSHCRECKNALSLAKRQRLVGGALPVAFLQAEQPPDTVFYERGSTLVPPKRPSRDEPA